MNESTSVGALRCAHAPYDALPFLEADFANLLHCAPVDAPVVIEALLPWQNLLHGPQSQKEARFPDDPALVYGDNLAIGTRFLALVIDNPHIYNTGQVEVTDCVEGDFGSTDCGIKEVRSTPPMRVRSNHSIVQ